MSAQKFCISLFSLLSFKTNVLFHWLKSAQIQNIFMRSNIKYWLSLKLFIIIRLVIYYVDWIGRLAPVSCKSSFMVTLFFYSFWHPHFLFLFWDPKTGDNRKWKIKFFKYFTPFLKILWTSSSNLKRVNAHHKFTLICLINSRNTSKRTKILKLQVLGVYSLSSAQLTSNWPFLNHFVQTFYTFINFLLNRLFQG